MKRSERLTVSALAAISTFMEAVGPETNEMLCCKDGASSKVQQDPRKTEQVRNLKCSTQEDPSSPHGWLCAVNLDIFAEYLPQIVEL